MLAGAANLRKPRTKARSRSGSPRNFAQILGDERATLRVAMLWKCIQLVPFDGAHASCVRHAGILPVTGFTHPLSQVVLTSFAVAVLVPQRNDELHVIVAGNDLNIDTAVSRLSVFQ